MASEKQNGAVTVIPQTILDILVCLIEREDLVVSFVSAGFIFYSVSCIRVMVR